MNKNSLIPTAESNLTVKMVEQSDASSKQINETDPSTNKIRGAVEYTFGCLLFTISVMVIRATYLNYTYIPVLTQNLYRTIPSLVISFYYVYNSFTLETALKCTIYSEYKISIISRSLIAFINLMSLTISANFLRVTTSSTFSSLNPIVTTFMALIFLGEVVTNTNVICLLISVFGCLLIAKPFTDTNDSSKVDSWLGIIAAIVFLISRSGSVILQKLISTKIDLQLLMLSINFVNIVFSLFIMIFITGDAIILTGMNEILLLFLSGILRYFAQYLTFSALYYADVVFLQLFYPSIILFGFISSIVFFNDQHDMYDYIGASLVLVINLYNSYEVLLEKNSK